MIPTRAFTFTGWHFLATITAFFVIVIGVDVSMIVMAYRSFPGQSMADPYEAGIEYNRILAERGREAALGWRAAAAGTAQGVVVEVRNRVGAPLNALTVTGTLTRPATESGAEHLRFRQVAPGIYKAPRASQPGAWDLDVVATDHAGHRFTAQRRLAWR
jgi:nitrogen fixation protein FixH